MSSRLVVIFNEDYSRNIPVLEEIYGTRFKDRVYIVPDHFSRLESLYQKNKVPRQLLWTAERVAHKLRRLLGKRNRHEVPARESPKSLIRVVGNKWYFQHFISQARNLIQSDHAEWYWFIGDDVLLNPAIDESNILNFLSVPDDARAVLCRPEQKTDRWVSWFQRSANECRSLLHNLDNRYGTGLGEQPIESMPAFGACADFFGIHREILSNTLNAFELSARLGLFVEIAVPAILGVIENAPCFIGRYTWDFDSDRGTGEKLEAFWSDPEHVFYHPCKLSDSKVARRVASHYAQQRLGVRA